MATGATYQVQGGDNLMAIAKKVYGNERMFAEIMRLNGLSGTTIRPGQVLRLPVNKPNEQIYIAPGGQFASAGQLNEFYSKNAGQKAPANLAGTSPFAGTSAQSQIKNVFTTSMAESQNAQLRAAPLVPQNVYQKGTLTSLDTLRAQQPITRAEFLQRQQNAADIRFAQQQKETQARMESYKVPAGTTFTVKPSQIPGGSGGMQPTTFLAGGERLNPFAYSAERQPPKGIYTNNYLTEIVDPVTGQALPQQTTPTIGVDRTGGAPITLPALPTEDQRKALIEQKITSLKTAPPTDATKMQMDAYFAARDNQTKLDLLTARQLVNTLGLRPDDAEYQAIMGQAGYSSAQAATEQALADFDTSMSNIGYYGTWPQQMVIQTGGGGAKPGGGGDAGFGKYKLSGPITMR
jgi:LysM repeat protein